MVTELVTRVEPVKLSGTVTRTGCALTVTIFCAQAEEALAKANNRTKTLRRPVPSVRWEVEMEIRSSGRPADAITGAPKTRVSFTVGIPVVEPHVILAATDGQVVPILIGDRPDGGDCPGFFHPFPDLGMAVGK